jgi:hypothetical protein
MRNSHYRFCLLATLAANACSSSDTKAPAASVPSRSGAVPVQTAPSGVVTFYENVAPIAARHCTGCHQPGSIAPFSLVDYASAAPHAASIAAATVARQMPPMPVDNGGQCNTYANARWLDDGEIATFQAWFAQGAPEGDPALAGPAPAPPSGLDRVDAELSMPSEYSSRHDDPAHHDDYHCFVLPAASANDAFVTGFEVIPGEARVVHHVIAFQPRNDAAAAQASALDAAEPGEGYTCFGGPGVDADLFAGWAPGAGPTYLPEGTGVALAGGRDVILQVHYNLAQGVFPDRTRVRLRLSESVERPGYYAPMADLDLVLPPGQADAQATRRAVFNLPAPLTIHGVLPHMHGLGRTLHMELESAGASTCLVDVDRWDFHWQNTWWYDTPLAFPGVDALSIQCGYDTRSRTDVVTWGEGTADEMCLAYLYVTSPALALLRNR